MLKPNLASELGEIIDISPLISPRIAVFPGDLGFSRDVSMDFDRGHHLALSSIRSTVHLGAHTDSPRHYHAKGEAMHERALAYYLGSCQVISVPRAQGRRFGLNDLETTHFRAPRILFKTGSFPDPEQWTDEFWAPAPELIEKMAEVGVILVGIDTPSIDVADSKDLPCHQLVFAKNMAILEGIVLEKVPDGLYTLIALPLALEHADASPVRAVLIAGKGI